MKNKLYLFIFKFIIYSIAATCRYRITGYKNEVFPRKSMEKLLSFWHRNILAFTFIYRYHQAYVLISQSKDGQLISNIVESMGYLTVRGSSRRGAIAALKNLRQITGKTSNNIAITPDGPKGPALKVQPGVIYLSLKTKRPLIAVSANINRKMILPSWDGFIIPLPFSHIHIHISDPYYPDQDKSIERNLKDFEKIMRYDFLH